MKTYLGLGSNLGDRLGFLHKAVVSLSKIGVVSKISSVYATPPWGNEDQPAFLNAVVEFQTKETPENLLDKLKTIETELGRQNREHWGPREIDIDILFYGNEQIKTQRLTIPHPLLQERGFVLVPLNEIATDLMHPVLKKTVREMISEINTSDIVKAELNPL